ncbi:TetR/AcrR family transcriptional regulator [Paenibacillus sp. HN-1]|uniref:TetR/AcrR family transcriptional regulator n=1 Tax=Paenibacillus TaxID=44249 RepID=UPI001CA91B91|nr:MULTISPECIES: TetR/AcrR family transcriptional regulator [Paenibacillus]MBY9078233.1 TetR/AcrR family transcriptional regulator [Paenibacillus sp. CGMCC 1.18879]MBY9086108.1 TetR/AcrR family transcriptional regulator [Paenibacillus sinensis]
MKERKEREREKQRELILQAADEIFAQEGLEKLSIRKIADKIEYSPAIIYHYFENKEDILNHLMTRGYGKLMSSLSSSAQDGQDDPEIRLRKLMRSYIEAALDMPDEYMAVQLNPSPEILRHTSMFYKGASLHNPALSLLSQCLNEIMGTGREPGSEASELTAQVIAASSLGLVIKLIQEKDIGEEQRERLIRNYIDWAVAGTKAL